jgi:transposase InsO family protein
MGNRVLRNFNPDAPNKIWVSDVTEFNYKNVTIYICAVMDLFSRKIIGCKFSHSNNTHLLKMTFRQAYDSRHPGEGLIFHSDRGGNYRSRTMQLMLTSLCIDQSFSKSHTPYDNSVSEAFFKSLKTEELYRSIYRSEAELKACISKYIEFFNNERPHKTLNYLTPAKKEEMYFSKHQTQTTWPIKNWEVPKSLPLRDFFEFSPTLTSSAS